MYRLRLLIVVWVQYRINQYVACYPCMCYVYQSHWSPEFSLCQYWYNSCCITSPWYPNKAKPKPPFRFIHSSSAPTTLSNTIFFFLTKWSILIDDNHGKVTIFIPHTEPSGKCNWPQYHKTPVPMSKPNSRGHTDLTFSNLGFT